MTILQLTNISEALLDRGILGLLAAVLMAAVIYLQAKINTKDTQILDITSKSIEAFVSMGALLTTVSDTTNSLPDKVREKLRDDLLAIEKSCLANKQTIMKKLNQFNNAISKLREIKFKFGEKNIPTDMICIGDELAPLGFIEGDSAKTLDIVDGAYVVVYHTQRGKFPKHYHTVLESGIMVSGSMRIYTPDETFVVQEGQSYSIPAFVWHAVDFIGKQNSVIMQFHPPFDSGVWEATVG